MKYLLLLSLLSVAAYLAFNWVSDWVDTKKVHDLLPKSSGRILLGLSTALAIVLMLCFAFMQDDAYISFRYSKNLALGNGLSWNIGDKPPVQGYTNFLWVLIMSAPLALGLNIELTITALGILAALLTICFTYLLSLNIFKDRAKAALPVFLLSTNYSFLAYATGGLETQLATLCGVLAWYLASLPMLGGTCTSSFTEGGRNSKQTQNLLLLISIVVAIAYLVRMDTLLVTGPCIIFIAVKILRNDCSSRAKLRHFLPLTLPLAILVTCYSAFSLHKYGSLLPNTFYVKAHSFPAQNILNGAVYIIQFLVFYGWPVILVLIFWRRLRTWPWKTSADIWLFMLSTICLTIAYSLRVGGDFMEFRFLIPIMPALFIILGKEILRLGPKLIFVALISLPLFSAANAFGLVPRVNGVESFRQLHGHLYNRNENWIGVGKRLKTIFPATNEELIIGVTPAGAIPYYSDLRSVDLLGLNDRFIAKNGVIIGSRPGHSKGPTLHYLYQSKINLLIGHPQVRHRNQPFLLGAFMRSFCWFMSEKDCRNLEKSSPKVLTMIIDESYLLDMIYLSPSKYVDEALNRQDLTVAYGGGNKSHAH